MVKTTKLLVTVVTGVNISTDCVGLQPTSTQRCVVREAPGLGGASVNVGV